jgi:lipopolysaccharide/colanic/teichoic acid biosynthesis glycosyltransferase
MSSNPEKVYREEIMQDKLELNLKYLQEWSFWGDIRIIFTTIYHIVR